MTYERLMLAMSNDKGLLMVLNNANMPRIHKASVLAMRGYVTIKRTLPNSSVSVVHLTDKGKQAVESIQSRKQASIVAEAARLNDQSATPPTTTKRVQWTARGHSGKAYPVARTTTRNGRQVLHLQLTDKIVYPMYADDSRLQGAA